MDIYAILSTRPHNPHYLNRYIRFIRDCQQKNLGFEGYTEKHHICPKSLFPEYKSLSKHPWNNATLNARQHFIAHWILWKAYPDSNSMCYAFWTLSCIRDLKVNSKTYSKLKEEYRESIKEIQNRKIKNGTHNLLDREAARRRAKERVENGTHNFLGGELQKQRVKNGTHNLLGPDTNKKRVKDGTHPWLGPEHNKRRIEAGTHNLLSGEIQKISNKNRIDNGTHNLLGIVSCYDEKGNYVRVPREEYHNQIGDKEKWKYVRVTSNEGRRRKSFKQ